MNILHIHERLEECGGTEKHIARLRKIFEAKGFHTRLLVTRPVNNKQYYWNEHEHPDESLVESIFFLDQAVIQLLDKYKPDIILVHGISFPTFLSSLFQKATCPIFRYMHEPRMVCPGHVKFWHRSETCCEKPVGSHCLFHAYTEICAPRNPRKLLNQFRNTRFEITAAVKYYAKIIVASDYMKNEAALGGLPTEKIVKIPPPSDLNPIPFVPVKSGSYRILFVGRMSPTKGPHILIRLLAPLLQKHSEWQLDFVGDGLIKTVCMELSQQYGISKQTHFHGWKSGADLDAFYQQASIVAFPTIYPEAFGGVGLEAFRHGRAVVGFDVGGVSEWLEDGVNGRLIDLGDTEAFRSSILSLLNDRSSLNQMGEKSNKIVYQHFGPEVSFEKYCNLFTKSL